MVELNKKGLPKGKPGRPPTVELYPGKRFGYLEVLRKVHKKGTNKTKGVVELFIRVQCKAPVKTGGTFFCNKIIDTKTAYLTRKPNPQTHCGCQTYIGVNPYPREKGIWHMMYVRTEKPNHVSYHHYGGRGIKVCPEWHKSNPKGWENFIAFVGPAPTPQHSIDRVNPNLGYQPYQEDGVTRQVRWATAREQMNNQRKDWPPTKK